MSRKKNFNQIILGLFVVILIGLLYFSPAEETLGNWIKIIYFHASIARNGIIFFVLAAVTGLIALRKDSLSEWAKKFQTMAFSLWVIQVIMGFFVMWNVWGGFLWDEPKVRTSFIILFFSFLMYLFTEKIDTTKKMAVSYTALALIVVFLLVTTEEIFHPQNAIASSSSMSLKIFFEAISWSVFIICFQITRYIKN